MKELIKIQSELKAPKGNYNSFGKYKYRSCEDILEAVKPLLAKYECQLTIADDIVMIGEKYFVKAMATIHKGDERVQTQAFAELDTHKGMSADQCVGTASSYARKYCLNGLFLIDDTKDSDTDEAHVEREQKTKSSPKAKKPTKEQEQLKARCEKLGVALKDVCKQAGWTSGVFTDEHFIKANLILEEVESAIK